MTVFSNNSSVGVVLNTYEVTNPVSVTSGTTLSSATGTAMTGQVTAWTIQNSGVIQNTATAGDGILLQHGGSITNASGASILAAGGDGVRITAASGSVLNNGGTIRGLASGNVGVGVSLYSGYVGNFSAGSITGAYGVVISGDGTVVNSGNINAQARAGVWLQATGVVTNSGTIQGATGLLGLGEGGQSVTVANSGVISGGSLSGISLSAGGAVANAASGTVYGLHDGIYASGHIGATVSNFGTVTGHTADAVHFHNSAASRLIMDSAAVFHGNVVGNTVSSTLELNSLSGAGTLSGMGSTITNFDTVVVDANAAWTVATGNTFIQAGTLEADGVLVNYGSVVTGVKVGVSGILTNTAGGVISGRLTSSPGPAIAVAAGGSLFNAGTVTDAVNTNGGISFAGTADLTNVAGGLIHNTGVGVGFSGIGTVENQGSIASSASFGIGLTVGGSVTNSAAGVISGRYGIKATSGLTTVDNAGIISATTLAAVSAAGGSVTNHVGGTISGVYSGVDLGTGVAAVSNAGSIHGGTYGVYLHGAGTVTNASGASISGQKAIYLLNGGYVANQGIVAGGGGTFGGSGNGAGIYIKAGGTVVNNASGTISGFYGVEAFGSAGTVTNNGGTITGSYVGVNLNNDADAVSNTGSIHGDTYGVYLSGADTVTNASGASISGHGAIFLNNGGHVTNQGILAGGTNGPAGTVAAGAGIHVKSGGTLVNNASGTISGFFGIQMLGSAGAVTNSGIISGVVGLAAGSATVSNTGRISGTGTGVSLGAGGNFTNDFASSNNTITAVGSVSGGTGIDATGAVTVSNFGSIIGTTGIGVFLEAGGRVFNQTEGSSLGTDYGLISGVRGVVLSADGLVSNSGTISGGVTFATTGTLTNEVSPGGLITSSGYGVVIVGAGVVVNDSSIIASGPNAGVKIGSGAVTNVGSALIQGAVGVALTGAGSISNSGRIIGAADGISLGAGGFVTNTTYSSFIGTISGGTGVYASGSATVSNGGGITGTAVDGIWLHGGGAVTNTASGTITGGTGVVVDGAGTVLNSGHMSGGTNGVRMGAVSGLPPSDALTNAVGGRIAGTTGGVFVDGNALVSNAGSITGGYGISIAGTAAVVNNTGVITGTNGGGDGVSVGSYLTQSSSPVDVTLFNSAAGVIYGNGIGVNLLNGGTVTNAGVLAGFQASVYLGGTGSNRLVVESGAGFAGTAKGGTLASNTLELASASASGTIADIGSSFTHFDQVAVDAGASWVLNGNNYLSASATLTNSGAILVAGHLNDSGVVLNNGQVTVDHSMYAGQLLGTGIVVVAGGAYLDVDGTLAAGQYLDLGGNDTLSLGNTAAAFGTIGGFNSTDTIDLSHLSYDSADQIVLLAGNVLEITESNEATFDLHLSSEQSFAGYRFGLKSDGSSGTDVTLSVPVASIAASPGTADLGAGHLVSFTLTMASAVTITGTPTLTLNDGGTAVYDHTLSTATSLVFTYAVQAGQNTPDLAVTAVLLQGASVSDGHGQPADLSGAIANPAGILQIDTTAPAAPTLGLDLSSDSGLLNDHLTNITAPLITGSGEAGDGIALYDGGTLVGTGTVGENGLWSITSSTLANGLHSLTVVQTDPAGNASPASAVLALTIDTTVPLAPSALTLAPASDSGTLGDDLTSVATPAITGTGVTGDTVTLYDGAGTTAIGSTVITAADGSWSITPTAALANGLHTLTATQASPAGNVSPVSAALPLTIDTAVPLAPSGLTLAPASDSGTLSDDLTNVATPAIIGTGVTGDTVTLYDGAGTTAIGSTVITAADGSWSITPTAALANGLHTLTATQASPAGNVSPASATLPLSIDTTLPAAPSGLTLAPASDSGTLGDDLTSVATPAITGTGVTGDTVTLYDGAGTTAIGSTVITAADGSWSITPTAALANGLHNLTATQASPAGNASPVSAALPLTIDTAVPLAPSGLTLAPASDSGTLGDDLTSVATPAITGTGVTGDTVTLYDGAGTTAIGSTVITAADGSWSITPTAALANGLHTLTATQASPAGNASPVSAALPLTIDTVAPATPTLAESAASTNPAKPVITGLAEAGSLVRLYQDGAAIGTATAAADGWTFTYSNALAVGQHTLSATATDGAGNTSAASSALTLVVNPDQSYAVVTPISGTDTKKSYVYDSGGTLSTVQTNAAQGQLLVSVSNTAALINIYDTAGTLIGTIAQPSTSAFSQPVFATTPNTLAASTGSGPIGSVVDLLAETNNFVSQGNDTITTHAGTPTITATGPTTLVNNVGANLTFYGRTGATTVYGGSGSLTAVGGSGGGTLIGGTAGNNVLAAGGGTTTLVGVANGDTLFGSDTGTDTLFAGSGPGAGAETLVGGAGSETLIAHTGDTAFGGAGQSTLFSGPDGGSTLVGGSGTSVLVADGGTETLWGGSGTSTLWAGSGNDVMGGNASINSTTIMNGGAGNDTFIGSNGSSTAFGRTGNDTFWSGTGAMQIVEGSGNDTVVFGSGATTVTGGTGTDLYTFINGQAGGTDVIFGFKVGVDQVNLFGYGTAAPQQQATGGGTLLSLADHTTILLAGVTQLAPNSIAQG